MIRFRLYLVSSILLSCLLTGCETEIPAIYSGTAEDPWLIHSSKDLIEIRDKINSENEVYGKMVYKLVADIDMSGVNAWIPIGLNDTIPFKGVFDGNGHVIRNLTMRNQVAVLFSYAGLFGYIEVGSVKKLRVEWKSFDFIGDYAGGIAGIIMGSSIEECSTSGSIFSGGSSGGIAGFIGEDMDETNNESIIRRCFSNCDITATDTEWGFIGGVAGGIAGVAAGTIEYCYSTGKIVSDGFSGGIVGTNSLNYDDLTLNCYSTGDITAATDSNNNVYSGGICGILGNVVNCYSTGTVSSTSKSAEAYSGGIVGVGEMTMNCYSTGKVEATSTGENALSIAGGLAGMCFFVTNCYSISDVKSISSIGSITGGIAGSGSISSCLALNRSIKSICHSNIDFSYSNRISYTDQDIDNLNNNNFASAEINIQKGTSESDLQSITDFSNKEQHGELLTGNPVDLLNAYVTSKPLWGSIPLSRWVIKTGINNGYPVFE